MLPKMKLIFAASYTIGCDCKGHCFVINPSIAKLVLIYASLLDVIAKLFRRRMSDWIFPHTIEALSVLQFFRQNSSISSLVNLGGMKVGLKEFDRLNWIDTF